MERMDDKIKQQVALCTCTQKLRVFQVGEGKYRVSISNYLSRLGIREGGRILRLGGPKKISGAGQTKILIFRGI